MVQKTCIFPSKGFQPGVLSLCPAPFKPELFGLPQLRLALRLADLLRLRDGFCFAFCFTLRACSMSWEQGTEHLNLISIKREIWFGSRAKETS